METVFTTKRNETLYIGEDYNLFLRIPGSGYATGYVRKDGIVFSDAQWAASLLGEAYAEYLNKNEDAFKKQFKRTEEAFT